MVKLVVPWSHLSVGQLRPKCPLSRTKTPAEKLNKRPGSAANTERSLYSLHRRHRPKLLDGDGGSFENLGGAPGRRVRAVGRLLAGALAPAHRPQVPQPTNPSSGPGADAPKPSCPFCAGRESECAPQIFRVPPEDALPWRVRVIENLYPALRRDIEPPPATEGPDGEEEGPGERAVRGFGFHDVVIETPRHDVRLWDLGAEGVRDVLLAYASRVRQLLEHPAVKYVQVQP